MLECLLQFLITVLFVAIVLWGLRAGLEALGVAIPAPIQKIIGIIIALILLIMALQCLGIGTGGGLPLFRRG